MTITVPPANGSTIIDAATNSVIYSPNPDFAGNDSFQYTLTDTNGAVSATAALVSVTITSENDAPLAQDGTVTLVEDSSASITLSATDPDGDSLAYQILPVTIRFNTH